MLLFAPRAADGCVDAMVTQGIQQGTRLQQRATFCGSQFERAGAFLDGLAIGVDDQLDAQLRANAVAKLDHLPEFVGSIDVY
jgi:hypothetical protein